MNEPTTPTPACAAAGRVVAAGSPCREHVVIECEVPTFPPSAPGQFVQLLCRAADESAPGTAEWCDGRWPALSDRDLREAVPYLRRPFSIADRWDLPSGAVRLRFIARIVGPGTRWLGCLRPGDGLDVTGPLGRGFRIPTRASVTFVLVGGGVGLPPLLYLARRLWEQRARDVMLFCGARSRTLLPVELTAMPSSEAEPQPCVALPGGAAYGSVVATDDGSLGFPGSVTDALYAWFSTRRRPSGDVLVYACGPDAMLREVARLTRRQSCACQLCIERPMGCGLGTCLSCVVRVRDETTAAGWRWALACQDGPVFPRDELLDYADESAA